MKYYAYLCTRLWATKQAVTLSRVLFQAIYSRTLNWELLPNRNPKISQSSASPLYKEILPILTKLLKVSQIMGTSWENMQNSKSLYQDKDKKCSRSIPNCSLNHWAIGVSLRCIRKCLYLWGEIALICMTMTSVALTACGGDDKFLRKHLHWTERNLIATRRCRTLVIYLSDTAVRQVQNVTESVAYPDFTHVVRRLKADDWMP